ncbi:MAG TPA: hypothetical protein VLA39_10040 [Marinobacterium sp.]|nr:hypothetical protein [Marinobacterium sp.]
MTHPEKYLQHPKAIGLNIEPSTDCSAGPECMPLGLILNSKESFETGACIRISHPSLCPESEVHAQVIWCRRQPSGHQLAVEFRTEENLYRVRMLEQLCHIKLYQVERQREGEKISFDAAAAQWIAQYAAHFPTDGL